MSSLKFYVDFNNGTVSEVSVEDLKAAQELALEHVSLTNKDIVISDHNKTPLCEAKWVLAKPTYSDDILCEVAGLGFYRNWHSI